MILEISKKHRKVIAPLEGPLAALFPDAPIITGAGKKFIAIDHGCDETRVLRNMGYDVSAPILSQYDWEGGTPYAVQKQTAALLTVHKRAYVLNSFGTGKTKAALWAWRYLYRAGLCGKLIVVAPLSTLTFTWAAEVFRTLPGVKCQVLHGERAKRLARLADKTADVYVINHDGLGVVLDDLKKRKDIDVLCIDELAAYRNGTADRTKAMKKYAEQMQWVWGMTGSPVPNAPTDAWAECSIITPHTVPRYFGRFRDAVMTKITQFKYVPKRDAINTVYAAMQPGVRFTLDDVVELPELVERTMDIEMGPEQKRVYTTMLNHARVAVGKKEITAMNAGAVLNKLLQISTGYVYTRDGQTVPLDNDERITAVVDACNAADNKVIIFVSFKHALKGIADRLIKEGHDVAVVSGDTPKGERDLIFNAFQNTQKITRIVAHPQCMSHGLTLTAADTIIWFGPVTSLETFEQANARIRRIGQSHKQLVLMLQSTAVEKKMYAKLRAKQKIQNSLLEMFEDASDTGEV